MPMPTWVFLGHVVHVVLHIPQKGFLKLQTQAPVRTQPGYGPWLAAHSWRSSGPAGPTQTWQPSPTSGPGQQTSTQTKFISNKNIYQYHMRFTWISWNTNNIILLMSFGSNPQRKTMHILMLTGWKIMDRWLIANRWLNAKATQLQCVNNETASPPH